MVRIRLPPPESPYLTQTRPLQVENRGFRAGVRRSVGGAEFAEIVVTDRDHYSNRSRCRAGNAHAAAGLTVLVEM
jgi:hypothetical protein